MKMFLGEYNPNLTEGSRIALPKKHREQISGDSVVLSKGFEKCIYVYDANDWAMNAEKQIENMKGDMKVSDLQRYLYTSAVDASVDSQGRLVLPANLKTYAGITTKTAVIGVGDHIEVWDYDMWVEYSDKISEKLSA
jgi:MraZ protein